MMGIHTQCSFLTFLFFSLPCRELKAARLAQTLMKDQPLGSAKLPESETSKQNSKRLVGGKNCRSFSFTLGYWICVVQENSGCWMALWKQRVCPDQHPILALPVVCFVSLILYDEMLAEEREEWLAHKYKMWFKSIVLGLTCFISCVTGLLLD